MDHQATAGESTQAHGLQARPYHSSSTETYTEGVEQEATGPVTMAAPRQAPPEETQFIARRQLQLPSVLAAALRAAETAELAEAAWSPILPLIPQYILERAAVGAGSPAGLAAVAVEARTAAATVPTEGMERPPEVEPEAPARHLLAQPLPVAQEGVLEAQAMPSARMAIRCR